MNSSSTLYSQYENSFYVDGYNESESLSDLGLGDECRIEFMYLTSWPLEHGGRHRGNNNISCEDIRRTMFYGFELSWLNSFCKDGWIALVDYNNQLRCKGLLILKFSISLSFLFISLNKLSRVLYRATSTSSY
jgi:hypothetical protein